MSKEFGTAGVAQATQFGKDGIVVSSNLVEPRGEVLQSDGATASRLAGAEAVLGDEFVTLDQAVLLTGPVVLVAEDAALSGTAALVLTAGKPAILFDRPNIAPGFASWVYRIPSTWDGTSSASAVLWWATDNGDGSALSWNFTHERIQAGNDITASNAAAPVGGSFNPPGAANAIQTRIQSISAAGLDAAAPGDLVRFTLSSEGFDVNTSDRYVLALVITFPS
jgi:hypothetical protein